MNTEPLVLSDIEREVVLALREFAALNNLCNERDTTEEEDTALSNAELWLGWMPGISVAFDSLDDLVAYVNELTPETGDYPVREWAPKRAPWLASPDT